MELYAHDRAWVRQWFDALTPHSAGGTYVNFVSEDTGERVREVYGESKYGRLSQLKQIYDPHNVLRVNQNIKPAKLATLIAVQLRSPIGLPTAC